MCKWVKTLLFYQYKIFYSDELLQIASHHRFVIVNDRDEQTLNRKKSESF